MNFIFESDLQKRQQNHEHLWSTTCKGKGFAALIVLIDINSLCNK